MYDFLDRTRAMRNDESHITPETPEAELVESSHVVATIYLYITAVSITDLEMADKL